MRGGRRSPAPPAGVRDPVVAGIAALGVLLAGYLTVTKLSGGSAAFCAVGSGCDVVQASRYAMFLGLPTALWGAALYAAVGALALTPLSAKRWLGAFLLSVSGLAFSGYLTYVSVALIGALCAYCIGSAAVSLALPVALFLRRPAGGGRRGPARPARALTLGALTAAATVIVAAGVFVAGSPTQTAAYQEGLARHLGSSGAVFYGAFW